jgi:hypothetical protein
MFTGNSVRGFPDFANKSMNAWKLGSNANEKVAYLPVFQIMKK